MDCILASPIHVNGGCIFADPNEIVVDIGLRSPSAGGWNEENDGFKWQVEDDKIMVAVIKKFLELVNG